MHFFTALTALVDGPHEFLKVLATRAWAHTVAETEWSETTQGTDWHEFRYIRKNLTESDLFISQERAV